MRFGAIHVAFICLLVTLAVLGHSVWHHAALVIMGVLTQVFSGGHVVA